MNWFVYFAFLDIIQLQSFSEAEKAFGGTPFLFTEKGRLETSESEVQTRMYALFRSAEHRKQKKNLRIA